ncbi:MAG: glycosyl hydrolase family 28-related protein [Kiritimatiellia bacterium]|jgi:hypothetical protein
MKHMSILAMSCLLALAELPHRTLAKAPPAAASAVIDVRAQGAVGDNRADDTDAIQRAVDLALARRVINGVNRRVTGVAAPVVYIPAGRYRVSRTLVANGPIVFRADPKGMLVAAGDDLTILSVKAWRQTFENLAFMGGATHVVLEGRTDQGMVQFRGCSFVGANDVAVNIDLRSNVVVFNDCHFTDNEQALRTITDMTTLRDCWITSRKTMRDKAVIEARGDMMVVEGLCGVPLVGSVNQRWIDNYTGLFLNLRDCRFGGEGGGFTTIYNFAKPRANGGATSILVDGSLLCAGASEETGRAAVHCVQIPNKIEIRSSILRDAVPVTVREPIDPSFFAGVDPDFLSYALRDNVGFGANELPAVLREPAKLVQPRPFKGLAEGPTAAALDAACEAVAAKAWPDSWDGTDQGHVQATKPEDYVDLHLNVDSLCLDTFIDGTTIPNHDYLAFKPCGTDLVLLRRQKGMAPYLLIRDVAVDVDRHPFLTLKLKGDDNLKPDGFAIKIIDRETRALALAVEQLWPPYHTYRAFDLRKLYPGIGGPRRFDIKLYYLGLRIIHDLEVYHAEPGDALTIDFLRFEADTAAQP